MRKTFEIRGWWPRICKTFEIIRTIYSNNERSEQFLVTERFFNLISTKRTILLSFKCQILHLFFKWALTYRWFSIKFLSQKIPTLVICSEKRMKKKNALTIACSLIIIPIPCQHSRPSSTSTQSFIKLVYRFMLKIIHHL